MKSDQIPWWGHDYCVQTDMLYAVNIGLNSGLRLLCNFFRSVTWWRHQMETCSFHVTCNCPVVRGNHRSPVNSPHKGQWRGALMLSLICAWTNGWVNHRDTGDLRRHRAHYDVIVMILNFFQNSENICDLLNNTFIFARCCGSLAAVASVKYIRDSKYWILTFELSLTEIYGTSVTPTQTRSWSGRVKYTAVFSHSEIVSHEHIL